ncbi:hypothetical protein RSAG8_13996, partial [Rhizoctonia solani AG-8 WAC10335]
MTLVQHWERNINTLYIAFTANQAIYRYITEFEAPASESLPPFDVRDPKDVDFAKHPHKNAYFHPKVPLGGEAGWSDPTIKRRIFPKICIKGEDSGMRIIRTFGFHGVAQYGTILIAPFRCWTNSG